MNKVLIALLLIFGTEFAQAQPGKGMHEVSADIGKLSGLDLFYGLSYVSTTYGGHTDYRLIYSAGYKYYISNSIAIGVNLSQHSYEEDFYEASGGYYHHTYYDALSACAEMKGVYFNHSYFQVYGTFGLGIFYSTGRELLQRTTSVSMYISPLGLRIGRKFGVFGEVGIGYRGLLNGGVSVMLGDKRHPYKAAPRWD
ncbi:hypothetical protein CJD36_001735 [Flavipsychrobacter stenotrophus]|uniref:Outer membrane protein beta-barrel domain-containing protein n=1 Tax=Flavipsychrobacter stenotrophus TaxID=2077091 RepID=A0A2S7T165_9BACT|nr:hypothetical protein [Flavipsychrobacter stenotrophus]PQJ12496.1 hypothetical protein CJD36_001735 [Flavipsychrobacter stenotrophus]